MNNNDILEKVQNVLEEEFELKRPDLIPEANLYEGLGLDSLDSVDLAVALEREFAFKIVRAVDEEKIRAIRTIADICGFVREKLELADAG